MNLIGEWLEKRGSSDEEGPLGIAMQRQGAQQVDLAEVDRIASALTGVTRKSSGGLAQWRYRGRLVARQLDATHVVIRTDFAPRHELLSRHPETFQVPAKYERHMMIVADLESGDEGAIEDALMSAWALQSGHG